MLPDLDAIGFALGVPYSSKLGHRGFSHSLVFALASSLIGFAYNRWRLRRRGFTAPGIVALLLLFAAAASHPLLDMLTDGGLGVALLAPFSWTRFFFPVTPIPVSAIGVDADTGSVLAWEAALFLPLLASAFLVGVKRAPVRRPLLRWLPLAWTVVAFGIRMAISPGSV
jgi:inner membrane protein